MKDPIEIMEDLVEAQVDLVEDGLYPCHYCGRKVGVDELQALGPEPYAPGICRACSE